MIRRQGRTPARVRIGDKMAQQVTVPGVDRETLRSEIQAEYEVVAASPSKGFHFHTGRALAAKVGYGDDLLVGIPESSIESFAGTGNPFSLGPIAPGERVVDLGSGAGIGVDMTPAMVEKARRSAEGAGITNVEFRQGYAESLPVSDGWADVVISNGALNLVPDKVAVLRELTRVLKPGGRLQIADIVVHRAVPDEAKTDIDLWTG
jgi:arsenite methyltransferase